MKIIAIRFATAVLLAAALATAARADQAELDPSAPCTAARSDAVEYELDYTITVTAPYKTKLLKVWLPIPPNDETQIYSAIELDTFPTDVSPRFAEEPVFKNRFAYFEFANPQGAQVIRHRFLVKVWELRWNLKPESVVKPAAWPDSFAPYLSNESQAVVVADEHHEVLGQILARPTSSKLEIGKIMGYARDTFRYDHVTASLRGDSRHLIEKGAGHCSDFHGFCAAAGRALGFPTRITYGINTFAKASPSHCKLEAFLPPYGWVSFDVSETQKLTRAIEADTTLDDSAKRRLVDAAVGRLESGFRDNCWFLQTRGSDYELAPPAASRVPVVRTIYAEADGKPLPDPDPSNPEETTFSWMTAIKIDADRPVSYPFTDFNSLKP